MIVDIHNHILPNMDDGAQDINEMLCMAQQAVENEITHVIATPHHKNGTFSNDPIKILDKTAEVNNLLETNKIPLKVMPGMEMHLYADISQDLKNFKDYIVPLAGSNKYILIELPYTFIPHYTDAVFYQIQLMDMIPVIAHPERNSEIKKSPNKLYELVCKGALTQVTAGSICGLFGKKSQQFSFKLIKNNLVHFIASDAHNIENRSFKLSSAYEVINKKISPEYSEYFMTNAVHVLNGTEFNSITPTKLERKKRYTFSNN